METFSINQMEREMTTAMKRWKEAVEAHQEQSIKIQMESAWPQSDISGNLSTGCKDDPRRTGDPVLDRLDLEVGARTSVLDVGGGAGKYAICVPAVRPWWRHRQ